MTTGNVYGYLRVPNHLCTCVTFAFDVACETANDVEALVCIGNADAAVELRKSQPTADVIPLDTAEQSSCAL